MLTFVDLSLLLHHIVSKFRLVLIEIFSSLFLHKAPCIHHEHIIVFTLYHIDSLSLLLESSLVERNLLHHRWALLMQFVDISLV